jgi:hypothetical protein
MRLSCALLVWSLVFCASGSLARAQVAPTPSERTVAWGVELAAPSGSVASTVVDVPGAAWVRLHLEGTTLAGDAGAESATLRITGLLDGSEQLLDIESLAQWGRSSAYFNGPSVLVEVLSPVGVAESRLVVSSVTFADSGGFAARSLCEETDDRVPSSDPRVARLMNVGCTAWMFNDTNRMFLTAGHCPAVEGSVVQFNVPLSTSGGVMQHPPPSDQYAVDAASVQAQNQQVGADWTYFGVFVNSTTGLTPRQAQGANFTLADAPTVPGTMNVQVTGYGTVSAPVPAEWNQAQKTAVGPYTAFLYLHTPAPERTIARYRTDTSPGDSGAPICVEGNGVSIGIHTNAGCTITGGSNQGTACQHAALQTALLNPRSVCASGAGGGGGEVIAIGDAVNNVGLCNPQTGAFSKINTVGKRWAGLAYDAADDRLWGIDADGDVCTIQPDTGVWNHRGRVSGTGLIFTGLGFDPLARRLYGVTYADGQLWVIDTSSLVAQRIGSATGLAYAGLDFDAQERVLYALADEPGRCVLYRIQPTSGSATRIGELGQGISDVNGLGVDPVGGIYTIDATTEQLLVLNRESGAATALGSTGGLFGGRYGMAFRRQGQSGNGCGDADFNNDGVFPDTTDLLALVDVIGGGACAGCDPIDINRDGVFPDSDDVMVFLRVLSGGGC